jgi:hypothetical protein
VREALRRLGSDEWVIGLAAAVAIGYAGVIFVRSLIDLVVDVVNDRGTGGYLSFSISGREFPYERPVTAAVTLAALILLAAYLLRRSRQTNGTA